MVKFFGESDDLSEIAEHENLPKIGAKMYLIHEHLYNNPDHALVKEYCVCEAEVTGYLKGGYTEIRLVGPDPRGFLTPYYHKVSEIGQKVFYTGREAALMAKRMTEKYEQTWAWTKEPPMRRTWAYLLEE